MVTGHGTIDGRKVLRLPRTSRFRRLARRGHGREDVRDGLHGRQVGAPAIGLNDPGGARIQEGVVSLWRLR